MHNDKKSPNRLPFSEMSLEPVVERGLESMGYDQATPIQSRVIGPMLEGRDVIALAPTGTGKTLGYGIPLAQRMILEPPPMMRRARKRKGGDPGAKYVDPRRRLRGLVVVPTRELASQVASELRSLTKGSLIKVGAVWGKAALKPQRSFAIVKRRRPRVVVVMSDRPVATDRAPLRTTLYRVSPMGP